MTTRTPTPAGSALSARDQRPASTWQVVAWSVPSVRWAAAALALFLVGLAAQLLEVPVAVWWACYLACYLTGGWQSALEGLKALRAKRLDVDLLMIAAAIGAAAIGQIFDGALLIVIFATSGALEDLATRRTEDSVRSLLTLAPDRTARIRPGGGEEVVSADDLRIGDVVVVRPGERISADGVVVSGYSDVDQASITGESMPAQKATGDEVYAGTLNGSGGLRIEVSRNPSQTVVARIVAMVADASATKAKTQLFIEKVEQRYSAAVVAATIALVVVPMTLGADFESTLLRAMTFMIVASPCAVVLATMPPLLSAVANAGRHGVLVKSAVAMERLADVSVVALDKTGTLTRGRPRLTRIVLLQRDFDADGLLAVAAAAERSSEHPLGRAIVAAAQERGVAVPGAEEFIALPGRGVRATVHGRRIEVLSPARSGNPAVVSDMQNGGETVVVITVDGCPAGVMGLADDARSDAADAVRMIGRLTATGPVLLTGDHRQAATRLADEVGISDVRAGLLPARKVDAIRDLQAEGAKVLFAGDGVNDAPAMAAAHSSIAMGCAGADLSIETADAVVVRDDLAAIPTAVALARRARRVVIANLVIAATFIAVLVAWDLFGNLPLPLGVAGHEGSTILVALNGLRLLRSRAWRMP
ncbi:heavy metal translocating P-type ATPase [Mycobacterium deserti]|uniref:Heavy metal translocating P-type ATPase n=1 Tax=Mycobacterium deserti TaxID=2978347 RepID=A0ABT2MG99_9MYCO|nr:heavy metal translocating P-type ATPase [Mycobacterium deserti]MCT7660385.1 heavy metal translocating P-type ATPase [Mycobacterium deserti]